MKTLTESGFLKWAERNALMLDPGYPETAVLIFRPDPDQDRFWVVPPAPERRPFFFATLLDLMGEWKSCYVWRHLGNWPQSADPGRINDMVELQILKGLEFPLGTTDVVEFTKEESAALVTLMFSTSVFGWSVGEDLTIVPDHARYLLKTDHHGVVHVCFRDFDALTKWVAEMGAREFPLPKKIPDSTFKQPRWMEH
jgi:hypothetical protein